MTEYAARFDAFFEHLLTASRPELLVTFFTHTTHLGDARFIGVLALSVAVVLARRKYWGYLAGLALSVFGSLAASYLIKICIARVRPLPPVSLMDVAGYSFPSMHATVAAALYGFLIYMVIKLLHPPHHRAPLVAFLGLLIFLIGISRVYLGVHYASDVMAGFVLGILFAFLGSRLAARYN